jgi:hypothetical protein
MDDIDRQLERDEILEAAQIAVRKPVLPAKGSCYNCDEPLVVGCYCDSDCKQDHEKELMLRTNHPRLR